jgi:hypothetical protein
MFDLRYHVASLAAVFVALIIGILVGVGLAGSGVTKKADLQKAQLLQHRAEAQRDAAVAQLQEAQKTKHAFELAYPAIMSNKLEGKRIGVIFVGKSDDGINRAIDSTLTDAGAAAVRVISLSVPVDPANLDNVLFSKGPQFVKYAGNDKLENLGDALGVEFASGGKTPLWKTLAKQLIGERLGSTQQPVDGVVVARTVTPQQGDTMRFLQGVYTGIASVGVPAVGVEKSATTISAVKVFRNRGLSAVDDVDTPVGHVALALLLAGAPVGAYGTGDDADAVLPSLPSLGG